MVVMADTVLLFLKTAVYYLLYVFIPGYALFTILKPQQERLMAKLVYSIAFGLFIEIGISFLTCSLNITYLLRFIPLLFLLVLILNRRKIKIHKIQNRKNITRIAFRISMIILALILLYILTIWRYPYYRNICNIFSWDTLQHIAIAAEVKNHFPPMYPTIFGQPLNQYLIYYHEAALSGITGIEVYRLFSYIEPFFWGVYAIGVLALFIGGFNKNQLLVPLTIALGFVLFHFGATEFDFFAFGLFNLTAFIAVIFTGLLIYDLFNFDNSGLKGYISQAILIIILAIAKIAAVKFLIMVLFLFLLLDFLRKKLGLKKFPLDKKIISWIILLAIYLIANRLSGKNMFSESGMDIQIAFLKQHQFQVLAMPAWQKIVDALISWNMLCLKSITFYSITTLLFVKKLITHFGIYILCICACWRKKELLYVDYFVILMFIVGIGLNSIIYSRADSSAYLIYFSFPLVLYLTAKGLYAMRKSKKFILALLAFFIISCSENLLSSLRSIKQAIIINSGQSNYSNGVFMGLDFLRKNSTANSICIVNSVAMDRIPHLETLNDYNFNRKDFFNAVYYTRNYHYSAISERRFVLSTPFYLNYISGNGLIWQELFDDKAKLFTTHSKRELNRIIDKYNIAYIIIDKSRDFLGKDQDRIFNRYYEKVFSNKDIEVFKTG